MNAKRRTLLNNLIADLGIIKDDEETAYDAMPDSIKETPQGVILEEAIESIETAIGYLNEATEH
jgi:hypothetical protein